MRDSQKVFLLLCFFTALRIALFDVNACEWGDSYRVLASAKRISELSFPLENFQLPFFSAFIAPFLFIFKPLVAGRLVAALASFVVLILSYEVSKKIFPERDFHIWVPVILALSPVFFYWSLRITSITIFTALVLLAFYLFYDWRVDLVPRLIKEDPPLLNYIFIGLVIGLACLTRREGILLLPGFLFYFLRQKRWVETILFIFAWAVVVLPLFFGGSFVFANFSPNTFLADLFSYQVVTWNWVWFFSLSYLFLFIFPPFFVFVFKGVFSFLETTRDMLVHFPLFAFILLLEILVLLLWTFSVPLVLIPLMPLILPFFLEGVEKIFAKQDGVVFRTCILVPWFFVSLGLFVLYIVGQYYVRSYFLVLSRGGLVLALAFSALALIALFIQNAEKGRKLFFASLVAALSVSSFVVIGNQRKVYATVASLAKKAQSLEGRVAYSDETGVSWWYLDIQSDKGVYYEQDMNYEEDEQWQWLKENNIHYLLWTTEFNRGSVLDIVNADNYKDRFELKFQREQEIADAIDTFLIRQGVLPEREYPELESRIYEVKSDLR
ncbi:MAG: glycosyltransferase family 39 protein [Patescibacteria group bacterium]|nr:glycosyltransferase family 39 protein [Patescibacteria group bacterium]